MKSSKSLNDTSSKFDLPSEFKKNWELLVCEHFLDCFGDFFDRAPLLMTLVNTMVAAGQEITLKALDLKISSIKSVLNLKKETDAEMLSQVLKPLLKNNYKEIIDGQELIESFCSLFDEKLALILDA